MNILSVVLIFLAMAMQLKEESYLIISGKSITVDGTTSVGGFSCSYSIKEQYDTLFLNSGERNPYYFSLKVPEFQCGNFLLNKDFQSTLKANQYPQIAVKVSDLYQNRDGKLSGTVELDLVGKCKILHNIVFDKKYLKGNKFLSAEFMFKATEFNLTPPSRFGGLIKADDDMNIQVDLLIH